jgi:hypothetical protein
MNQYLTVKQLSQKYPAFPEGGIRHLIFHAEANGFQAVITRIGRKVLVIEAEFLKWLESHKCGRE